jgi:UDP-N-acetylmuramyl pentapeptide synthase
MKDMSEALSGNKIEKKHFTKRDLLEKYIRASEFSDSVILVKGSRGMKMEQFVKIIEEKIY